MKKQTKLSIAREIYREVHLQDHEDPRQVFINRLEAKIREIFGTEPKAKLAPSYYQMINYEANNKDGGIYRHHKNMHTRVGTVEPIAIVEVQEVAVVEVAEPIQEVAVEVKDWKVTVGEMTHYFDTRNEARNFKKDNGGKVEKVA